MYCQSRVSHAVTHTQMYSYRAYIYQSKCLTNREQGLNSSLLLHYVYTTIITIVTLLLQYFYTTIITRLTLLLNYLYTTAMLLLYYCYILLCYYYIFTILLLYTTILLLYYYYMYNTTTTTILMLYYYYTTAMLLLYYYCTTIQLLYYYYTTTILLLYTTMLLLYYCYLSTTLPRHLEPQSDIPTCMCVCELVYHTCPVQRLRLKSPDSPVHRSVLFSQLGRKNRCLPWKQMAACTGLSFSCLLTICVYIPATRRGTGILSETQTLVCKQEHLSVVTTHSMV